MVSQRKNSHGKLAQRPETSQNAAKPHAGIALSINYNHNLSKQIH
jgi:hypothetical protein